MNVEFSVTQNNQPPTNQSGLINLKNGEMRNIKEVIELGLNVAYATKRYEVEKVEIGRTLITVYYLDKLTGNSDNCQFEI